MVDAVIEFTQQQAAKRMAQTAEEYAAANSQLGFALSEVDRVRIRRQMEALAAEMRDLETRMFQPWHNYLPEIDFTRATQVFEGVTTRLKLRGGAALLMLQDCKTLGGQWCVERLRIASRRLTRDFRSFPVAIMLGDRLEACTFLARFGSHLGCPAPVGNDEATLRQAADALAQKLCDSLQSGSICFIELYLQQTDSLCESFLPWLMEQFWVPLVSERWPEVLRQNPLAKIMLLIQIEPPLRPARVPAAMECRPAAFDSTRILELPLQKWTQQEIETWLWCFSGLTSPPSPKTSDEVRHIAAEIYAASRKGTPETVYYHFLRRLPRDQRVSLGGLL